MYSMYMSCSDDTEKLIEEIKKRPALYQKNLKEYLDVCLKRKLWEEVCQAVTPNWEQLNIQKQIEQADEIQKKWANLRTCFRRELNIQRETTAGRVNKKKKRRRYLYFEKLRFLLPGYENDTALKSTVETVYSDGDNSKCEGDDTEDTREKITKSPKTAKFSPISVESSVTAGDKFDRDEDTNFALSIVPSLRKLTADEKLEAKIKILTIFRDIRKSRAQYSK